ncbi:hypothetical protein HUW63_08315 [Myxococcus sp. AM001]|nr:hypothetical protein [Myxococcus sp. AM001]
MSGPVRNQSSGVNVNVGLQAILPDEPEAIRACSITRQDLDILLEGSGVGYHRTQRDLMAGIFISAFTGTVGLFTSIPDTISNIPKLTAFFIILLGTTSMATIILFVQHHFQSKREAGRASFEKCKNRIERMLGEN